ncbi:hypothetical protein FPV67DRAFT_1456765 [Lyophyllum atratum]|nr:hypothetical protein FPV67DRAFT_1456765 [Lyophyllum atratum]
MSRSKRLTFSGSEQRSMNRSYEFVFRCCQSQISLSLDPNEVVVLERVIRILRDGWNDYIPLDVLTNDACRSATFAPSRHDDAAIALNQSGRLQVRASYIDASKEAEMTCFERMQAAHYFVEALPTHLLAGGNPSPGDYGAVAISR